MVDSPYSCQAQGESNEAESIHAYLRMIGFTCSTFVLYLLYSDGRFPRRSYSNEKLTVSLDDCIGCRAGLTIRDLQSFTIWCRDFSVFFTRLDIPADLFNVS